MQKCWEKEIAVFDGKEAAMVAAKIRGYAEGSVGRFKSGREEKSDRFEFR